MKSGFVAIVGRSNVGKSTLLNALIRQKLAATSPKPQTTRTQIRGIFNDPRGQLVFVDTPGIFDTHYDILTESMNKTAFEALNDIDCIIYLVDPTRAIGREESHVLNRVLASDKPKVLVINKMDYRHTPFLMEYEALAPQFNAVVKISARKNTNLEELVSTIFNFVDEGEPHYDSSQTTDIEQKNWMAEIIREKCLNALREEVPYTLMIEVTTVEERKAKTGGSVIFIHANIITSDKKYKKMIIGREGRQIKEIGQSARRELELILGKKIFLELEVMVDERWKEKMV